MRNPARRAAGEQRRRDAVEAYASAFRARAITRSTGGTIVARATNSPAITPVLPTPEGPYDGDEEPVLMPSPV